MNKALKELIKRQRKSVINYSARKKIHNKDFTIISNNCWGATVYQDLNLPYKTPFIGLYINSPCYLKLLNNFDYYMKQSLTFTDHSLYEKANIQREKEYYPLGKLDDIELHMIHYQNEKEATEKWIRRKERMNWDNIYVKISERDHCTEDILRSFNKTIFKNKICFVAKDYKNIEDKVFFSKDSKNGIVENEVKAYQKYFDIVDWLNNGKITLK